ncbi:MAG: hypothetical protein ACRDRJ_46105, partial [Streptosporangiaceae bacterium]
MDNVGMEEMIDQLAKGVGRVCIAASKLEWHLNYMTCVIKGIDFDKYPQEARSGVLGKFKSIRAQLIDIFGPEAATLAREAEDLLHKRNRVVHSASIHRSITADRFRSDSCPRSFPRWIRAQASCRSPVVRLVRGSWLGGGGRGGRGGRRDADRAGAG